MGGKSEKRWGILEEKWRFYQPISWFPSSEFLVEMLIFVHIYLLAAWLAVREAFFDRHDMIKEIKFELFSSRLWTQKTKKKRKMLVIGADGTIGKAIVSLLRQYSSFECHVVVHHLNSSEHDYQNDERMHVYEVDLIDKEQILLLADRLKSLEFDVAIFAAGIMLHAEERTRDGVEMHNAVNVVGQVMLYELLQNEIHRAVFLSSATARMACYPLTHDFLSAYAGPYQAYASSKLNLAVYVHEMVRERHVSAVCLHPGTVPGRLYRLANPLVRHLNATWLPLLMRTPEMAAALVLHTVFRDDLTPGAYYEDREPVAITAWLAEHEKLRIYSGIRRRIEMWMEQ